MYRYLLDSYKFMYYIRLFFQKEKYATRAVSWLADFVGFNRTTRYEVRPDTFVAVVHRVFLRSSRYEAYAADIAFAPLHTQIIASRMYLQLGQRARQNPLVFFYVLDNLYVMLCI